MSRYLTATESSECRDVEVLVSIRPSRGAMLKHCLQWERFMKLGRSSCYGHSPRLLVRPSLGMSPTRVMWAGVHELRHLLSSQMPFL